MRAIASFCLIFLALSLGLPASTSAQTAYRCELDGRIIYSDKPCPGGKAVAPTQDTPEQKQRAREARTEMKQDAAELARSAKEREAAELKAHQARAREAQALKRAEQGKPQAGKTPKKSARKATPRSKAAKKSSSASKGKKQEPRRDPILAPARP